MEEEVAREALLCLSRFWRAFRDEMGVTYAKYLRNLRVEKAEQLLASMSLSVEEIARQVGYEAPEAFGRAFRKVVGVAPSQYRRQLKGKAGSP
jgi:transcriptional regulator GlxA family with amidase domain